MKAEITYDSLWEEYNWVIYYSNGAVATVGPSYTRRDDAKRGLRNFVEKMWTTVGIKNIMDNL